MNPFESPEPSPASSEAEKKETPLRFRLAVEAILRSNLGTIEVQGEEHLEEIPPGKKLIIATTHVSDFDVLVPIAKLGKRFRMKAVNASVQHNASEDTRSYFGIRIAGIENTIPVDYTIEKNEKTGTAEYAARSFNPENFVPMRQALDEGDALVMAAYTPTPIKDGKLPKLGGNGAVYLAEIADAVILPVAIRLKSNESLGTRKNILRTILKQPDVEMCIGAPILPDKIEGIGDLAAILKKRKENPEAASKEDLVQLRTVHEALQVQSARVMHALARMLPKENRGPWGEETKEHE